MTLLDQAFTRRNDITKATANQTTTLYGLTKLKLYLSNISNRTQDFTMSCLLSAGKYVNRTKLQSKKSSIVFKQQRDSSSRFATNQNSLKLNLYSSESKEVHTTHQTDLIGPTNRPKRAIHLPLIKNVDKYWEENIPEEVRPVETKEFKSMLVRYPPHLNDVAIQSLSASASEEEYWLIDISSDISFVSDLTNDHVFSGPCDTKATTKQEPTTERGTIIGAKHVEDLKKADRLEDGIDDNNKKLNKINTRMNRHEQILKTYDLGKREYLNSKSPQTDFCRSARPTHLSRLKRCQSENLTSKPDYLSQLKRSQSESLHPQQHNSSPRNRSQSDSAAYMLGPGSPSSNSPHVRRRSAFASLREILTFDDFEDLPCNGLIKQSNTSNTGSTANTTRNSSCDDAGSFSRLLVQNQNKGFIEMRVKGENLTCHQAEIYSGKNYGKRQSGKSLIGSGTCRVLKRERKFIFRLFTPKIFGRPNLLRNKSGYLT